MDLGSENLYHNRCKISVSTKLTGQIELRYAACRLAYKLHERDNSRLVIHGSECVYGCPSRGGRPLTERDNVGVGRRRKRWFRD